MQFPEFISNLRQEFEQDLPGEDAQMLMSPLGRATHSKALEMIPNPKPSAVLILLYPMGDRVHSLLMLRNTYNGHHSGQVSFPGGKVEQSDIDLEFTARREFEEEMGLSPIQFQTIGKLSPLIVPPSGFIIHPFVAFTNESIVPIPDQTEVSEVIQPSLANLFADSNKQVELVHSTSQGFKLKAPVYKYENKTIWGATAMILSELEVMCKRFTF